MRSCVRQHHSLLLHTTPSGRSSCTWVLNKVTKQMSTSEMKWLEGHRFNSYRFFRTRIPRSTSTCCTWWRSLGIWRGWVPSSQQLIRERRRTVRRKLLGSLIDHSIHWCYLINPLASIIQNWVLNYVWLIIYLLITNYLLGSQTRVHQGLNDVQTK